MKRHAVDCSPAPRTTRACGAPQQPTVIYVYLNCGDVEEVRPADGVMLTERELLVLADDWPVARFARRDVYFATRERIAPPVMF
jgi:hypothetical protein